MRKQNKEPGVIPAAELSEEELQYQNKKNNKNYKNKKAKNREAIGLVDSLADVPVKTAESIVNLLKIPNTALQQARATNKAAFTVLVNHTGKINEKKA